MNTLRVGNPMTLITPPGDDAIRKHLRHLRLEGKSVSTIRHRQQALDRLRKELPVPLLEATPDHLYEWRSRLELANATIAVYVSHVKSFYAWALTKELIERTPAAVTPVPKLPRRFPRPIPEPDLMHALNSASHVMAVRPWLVLAGWCGLRCQEIAGLRVENLRMHDTPPVIIVAADSAKGGRERVVELSPFVIAEMTAARLPLSGYAFPDANGQPRSAWSVSRIGNEHLKGCGTKSTMHMLRHRFASQVYQATLDLRLVAELMGHASQNTTANYAAFSRTGATAAVASLPVPGQALEEAS